MNEARFAIGVYDEEFAEYIRQNFPIGVKVKSSKRWDCNNAGEKFVGRVVGYSRRYHGIGVVHDGRKSRHIYSWTFVVRAA